MPIMTGSAPEALFGVSDPAKRMHAVNDNSMIKPRKQMAMGTKPAGSIDGAGGWPGAMEHPDRAMNTGATMPEGSRGVAPPVSGGSGRMATASMPDHGPHDCKGR